MCYFLHRVTKDLSRSSYSGEFEAIMESYVQCYTFIFSMTTNDLGDNNDDNLFTQQLIIKVCLLYLVHSEYALH